MQATIIILSCDGVIVERGWIDNQIYLTHENTTHDYTFTNHYHTNTSVFSQSLLHYLVTSSYSAWSSAPELMSLQAVSHLTPTYCSSNCSLRTLDFRLYLDWLLMETGLGMDYTENTASESISAVAWAWYCCVLTKLLHSNGCLHWLSADMPYYKVKFRHCLPPFSSEPWGFLYTVEECKI
jgi:hypothetical protein